MNKELSAAQAFEGMRASLRNAEALIEEAKILADAKHPVRAIALAVLAYEELAKLLGYLAADDCAKEGRMKIWWDTFKSHGRKIATHDQLALAVLVDQLDPQFIEQVITGDTAKYLNQLKFAALYTGFRNSSFVCPLDMPGATERAESAIALADGWLCMHREAVDRLDADLLQQYWDSRHERSVRLEHNMERLYSALKRRLGEERYDALLLELQKPRKRPGQGPAKA